MTGDPCSRGCRRGRSWKAPPVFEVSSLWAEGSPWSRNGYKARKGMNLEFTLRSLRKGGGGAGPAHLPNPNSSSSELEPCLHRLKGQGLWRQSLYHLWHRSCLTCPLVWWVLVGRSRRGGTCVGQVGTLEGPAG